MTNTLKHRLLEPNIDIWESEKNERTRHVLVALRQMLIKETETWWLPFLEDYRNQAQASKKLQKFGKERMK